MPDQELLSHAAAGDLQNSAVLLAQTNRMPEGRTEVGAISPTEFGGKLAGVPAL